LREFSQGGRIVPSRDRLMARPLSKRPDRWTGAGPVRTCPAERQFGELLFAPDLLLEAQL